MRFASVGNMIYYGICLLNSFVVIVVCLIAFMNSRYILVCGLSCHRASNYKVGVIFR